MVRYEKYKDSGIAWIGEIPEHWRFCRIKRLGRVLTGTTPSTSIDRYFDREDINWYTPTDFSDDNIYLNNSSRCLSQAVLDEKIVQLYPPKCVLLIGIGGTLGRVGYSVDKCYSNQQINAIVFNNAVIPLYYAYSLQPIKAYIWSNANTATMPILNQSAIKNLFVAIPPTTEQEQIAKYLDWKCGEVDKIVAVREKQIELLGELRTSVISRAVTRGLNPNAPLKDSGIDWIGQIPEHWKVIKLKFIFAFGKGLSITKDDLTESGVAVISYGQIHSNENPGTGLNDCLKRYVPNDYLETNRQSLVNNNDFIFADTSEDLDGVGNCVFIDNDELLFAGYHTIILKAKTVQNNKYLAYLFLSDYWRDQIRSKVTGVKVYSITKTILNGNTVLFPSIVEQKNIADYLDKKTAEIDSTIEKFRVQIEKLKEYRQALITEVVTGKIDVRDIEIPAPKNN